MSRLFHVNAFSQHPFGGNPAIVVLGPERSDAELQAMAAEFNLSETAFLSPLGEAHYRLRWFTPTVEVDLCGHGTLAAAHVLWQTGEVARSQTLRFETRSGLLEARAEGEWIRLDFPRTPLAPLTLDPAYAEALGCTPLQTLAAGAKFLLVLGSEQEVQALKPDFHALRALPGRGLMVTAPSRDPDHDFVSRYFAPWVGVEEDPVTGSNHCALVPFWAERLGRTQLRARQISARGGELVLELQGDRVWMSGQALTLWQGEWLLPPCP
ncbi:MULTISPECIES: PhzF family phenazine biosynthesis protein [Aeromonas]|nr:phenazine biosynthesis PhzC/PhzF protein [Aeromonas media WS]QHQ50326.1 PhzF family phenazine biosynthesis isomerase [Aeromonas media]QJT29615.1 PhzF family phenazine biosynthesis protein [Aeromonas media]QJT35771.1 PhzF family phenazine biosynthesis protein [Aeromonas media]QJT37598.1 PhzF family phenazine biosynthesis protein [Aeromonas media]